MDPVIAQVREDFPSLHQKMHGKPLIYLDNAATTQKPKSVMEAITHYYSYDNANVHRGVHLLSQRATDAYEATRIKVRDFINATSEKEIIFTRGTTEAINLVAQSYGRTFLAADDEVIISTMEHHSNIVPWQLLSDQIGIKLKIIPINDKGELLLSEYEKLLTARTKLVAIGHISNALGTVNPLEKIIDRAHANNALVLVDGAQAAPHTAIDVQQLDCDFYSFSGHKVFGPTGIGVLYGRESLLEKMPPYQGGGEMIKMVSFDKTVYHDLPHRFEAGTPNIAGVVGLAPALDYISQLGLNKIQQHEHELLNYATEAVKGIDHLRLIGTADKKASILSFIFDDVHAHDVGTILDYEGIAVRTGHHCAMPVMQRFGVPATVRASFAFYNTKEDIDALVSALHKIREIFS